MKRNAVRGGGKDYYRVDEDESREGMAFENIIIERMKMKSAKGIKRKVLHRVYEGGNRRENQLKMASRFLYSHPNIWM